MRIIPADQPYIAAALALLRNSDLPVKDIQASTRIFILEDEGNVIGTVGIEHNGSEGLLRSLSVHPSRRSWGFGKELVQYIEQFARQHGVKDLYLLTTTASQFFYQRNYQVISREDVGPFIRQTSEFNSVCLSSAVIMKKSLQ